MPSRPQTVELDLPFERALPDRLRPMLPMAAAAPFDSADYAFDVAWDGVRALASVDRGRVGIWGRTLLDLTGRYPEVQVLADLLPPETIVDGELIVTDPEGRPDAVALARRQQAAGPEAVARAAAAHPATYVVHDLLYLRGRSWLKEPLVRRRPPHPACRGVGGFDNAPSSAMRKALDGLATGSAPDDPRWMDDRICWVTPQLVVAVKFSEWDLKGQLRFPIFSGLRPEVAPDECARTPMVEPPLRSKPRLVEIQLPRLPL